MDWEKQKKLVDETQVAIDHPEFHSRIFSLLSKNRRESDLKSGDNFKKICLEEFDEISGYCDQLSIQESCSVRNVLRTRRLANLLITDQGELHKSFLPKVIQLLEENLYSLGPERQYDAKRQEQILFVLRQLQENAELNRLLKKISRPISHKHAEQIIRDTLQLPHNQTVTDAHAKRAVLAAWMCTLRQSVGSCFATAPAIIIHDEQPKRFLQDIDELLSTGRLKRTFGGVEYSVPLSSSWGVGDLRKKFLLNRNDENAILILSQQPGFAYALEAIQFIDSEKSFEEKQQQIREILEPVFSTWEGHEELLLISIEQILKRILLKHFDITPQDLQEYENRPKPMLHSQLILHATHSSGMGGKGEACANYYRTFEIASNAFKGLADNALLKAWEFTIASFSETKANFARWNLYSSLGLGPEEHGGIGECIYAIIKTKLEMTNQKVQDFQSEYEQLFNQLKYLEGRIRQATTEKEVQWIKVEYQSKSQEFHTFQELRDKTHLKAKKYADLFNFLINQYDDMFPEYFQEVYDADMHDVRTGFYDDSPAGFRLLYKHGRSNTAQWTSIKSANEFVEALISFFNVTETALVSLPQLSDMREDISEIVTSIVSHLRTDIFIETAFHRMAIAHHMPLVKNPLENLDKIEKKPWAYTSGGTMGTLVSCYYKREQKPSEVSRWVENERELLVFLIDTLRQMQTQLSKEFVDDPKKSMLMHSPTHAFLLKPGSHFLKKGWQVDSYTYTWSRDHLIVPMENFIKNLILDDQMMHYLLERIEKIIPLNYVHHFKNVFRKMSGHQSPSDFRTYILDTIAYDRGFRSSFGAVLQSDEIDSLLYSLLPLFPRNELRDRLKKILEKLSRMTPEFLEQLLSLFDSLEDMRVLQPITSSKELKSIAISLISLATGHTSSPDNLHFEVSLAAQKLGFALPSPIIFGDSNWVKDEFGFVVNPGNEKLELWRIDYTGSKGMPMSSWKQWLNGSRHDLQWGVYHHPHEYQS